MLGVVLIVVIRSVCPKVWLVKKAFGSGWVPAGGLAGLQNNPLGVGVDGFQDAYLGVRRAGDAEEVRSAHALLADWLVILGVFALPWMWVLARTTFSSVREIVFPPAVSCRTFCCSGLGFGVAG